MRMRVFLALIGAVLAHGAGMTTHTIAGYRAISYFGKVMHSPNASLYNDALESNTEAVLAGSDFPDFLYACGKYTDHHDAGEYAHWPPFQKAMVQYIRDTKPDFHTQNWTAETKTLVAFLMGTGVHFMADELWEGLTSELKGGQGFVRLVSTMGLNHDGHSDNDESIANMAADFYLPWALDMSAIHPWKRTYPLQDVFNVYTNYTQFTDVTLKSLTNCHYLFDLGLWAEKTFGALLFPWYAEVSKQVPIVAEMLFDYPLGGVDDMGVWASFVWERLANWLDVGPPAVAPPVRRLLEDVHAVNNSGDEQDDRFTHDFLSRFEPFSAYHDQIMAIDDGAGLFTWRNPNRPLEGLVFHGPKELRSVLVSMLEVVRTTVFPKQHVLTTQPLQIFDAADVALPIAESDKAIAPESTFTGTQAVGYAGAALAAGDLNNDGIRDLVYTEYGTGEPGKPQVGSVTVDFGNHSQTLVGQHLHSWFGKSVVVLDLNADGVDDLVVGAPHASWNESETIIPYDAPAHFRLRGKVFVYLGSKTGLQQQADITLSTETDFSTLGWSLQSGDLDGDGKLDLIMGCPLWSSCPDGCNQIGRVFGLHASQSLLSGAVIDVDSSLEIMTIQGPSNYDWFGQSVVALPGGNSILVGAPGHRWNGTTVGAVYHYTSINNTWTLASVVRGVDSLGEFGHALALDQTVTPPVVAVSAPATTLSTTKLRSGVVYLFHPVTTNTTVSQLELVSRVMGASPLARTGWLVDFTDCDGDGKLDLVVGSPMTNGMLLYDNREAGEVSVWFDTCLLYTSPSPRDRTRSRMPSSA
eukprot:TRINITY_DN5387_c0_g1_i6.p1 TRINITY_DN5387_c0_g1~~TRINITY_DN5387_c0_g1_i6.p1  ORF type:complete len:806 (+),score=133.13 TRINITY_DN5387_c0_g1_i6:207-2624(+)